MNNAATTAKTGAFALDCDFDDTEPDAHAGLAYIEEAEHERDNAERCILTFIQSDAEAEVLAFGRRFINLWDRGNWTGFFALLDEARKVYLDRSINWNDGLRIMSEAVDHTCRMKIDDDFYATMFLQFVSASLQLSDGGAFKGSYIGFDGQHFFI